VSDMVTTMCGIPGYVESAVAKSRLVVQSINVAAMKDHKTQAPSVPVGLLGTPTASKLPVLARWADQVNPNHVSVDRAYVDQVHRLGMACLVWTVNWGPAMRRALRIGVDGIITNRPDVLGHELARHTSTRSWPTVSANLQAVIASQHSCAPVRSVRAAVASRTRERRERWAAPPSRCDGSQRLTGGTCLSRTSRPAR
jgi:hypothetical protein